MPAMDHTLHWLANSGGISSELLRSHSYLLEDGHVARHAFRVASGLDSMVLGEAQILGQMKNAVRAAENADRKSTRLNSSHLVISYAVFCLKKKKDNANE